MINTSLFVFPCITVCVEMNQGYGAVFFRICLDNWIGDEVIAAQDQHGRILLQNGSRMRVYFIRDLVGAAWIK